MAEIKFTTERMKQVQSQLVDLVADLEMATNKSENSLQTISNNIISERIAKVLTSFSKEINRQYYVLKNDLKYLDKYLSKKIGAYSEVDEEGVNALSKVQERLNKLG